MAALDQVLRGLIDALMDRFEKMLGCQKARNRRGAVVVDEDRPQQRLLGFDVARLRAVGREIGAVLNRGQKGSR